MKIKNFTLVAAGLLISAMSSCSLRPDATKIDDGFSSEMVIQDFGIQVKRLSTGTNSNGKDYVTMSYEIAPAYTAQKSISISCRWKSAANQAELQSIDNYLGVSIDNYDQTFTVTKLQDLPALAIVKLQSTFDESIYAEVEVHQRQKFLGFSNTTTLQKAQVDSSMVTQATHSAFTNPYYRGWLQSEFISTFSNGFTSTYTDAIDTYAKIKNLDLEEIEYRYIGATGTLLVPFAVSAAVATGLETYVTPEIETYLRTASVLQPAQNAAAGSSYANAFVLLTAPEVSASFSDGLSAAIADHAQNGDQASFITTLNTYEFGLSMDLHFSFDLELGGQTKSGLDGWLCLKIPYSAYEEASDIPLDGITPEVTEYYF